MALLAIVAKKAWKIRENVQETKYVRELLSIIVSRFITKLHFSIYYLAVHSSFSQINTLIKHGVVRYSMKDIPV
jgi:hypothetical protein